MLLKIQPQWVRLLLCFRFYPELLGYQAASCSCASQAMQITTANPVQGIRNGLLSPAQPWHSPSRGANPKVSPSACKAWQRCRDLWWAISWGNRRRHNACLRFVDLGSCLKVEISEKFGVWLERTGFFTDNLNTIQLTAKSWIRKNALC